MWHHALECVSATFKFTAKVTVFLRNITGKHKASVTAHVDLKNRRMSKSGGQRTVENQLLSF